MALKDYYDGLSKKSPQKELLENIARECGVTEMSAYRWITGEVVPHILKQEKISQLTGISVNELFQNQGENEPA